MYKKTDIFIQNPDPKFFKVLRSVRK